MSELASLQVVSGRLFVLDTCLRRHFHPSGYRLVSQACKSHFLHVCISFVALKQAPENTSLDIVLMAWLQVLIFLPSQKCSVCSLLHSA